MRRREARARALTNVSAIRYFKEVTDTRFHRHIDGIDTKPARALTDTIWAEPGAANDY